VSKDLVRKAEKQLEARQFLALERTIKQLETSKRKLATEFRLRALLEQNKLAELEAKLDEYLGSYKEVPYDNIIAAARIKSGSGQHSAAIAYCQRAILLDEMNPEAAEILFVSLLNSKQYDAAYKVINRILELIGEKSQYLQWQVIVCSQMPSYREGLEAWEKLSASVDVEKLAEKGAVFSSVIRCYVGMGRIEDARMVASQYDLYNSDDRDIEAALPEITRSSGDIDGWATELATIADKYPDEITGVWNSSLALLAAGRLEEGWERYECRWDWKDFPSKKREFDIPRWSGESLTDKKILIWGEQGVGDQLMFLNTLPEIFDLSPSEVVIEVLGKLVPIVEAWYPETVVRQMGPSVVTRDSTEGYQDFDFQIPSGSLPRYFFSSQEQIKTAKRRFMTLSYSMRKSLLGQFGDQYQKIVGLAWRSSMLTSNRAFLYLNVNAMLRIVDTSPPGVGFVVLQYGLTSEEKELLQSTGKVFVPEYDFYDDIFMNGQFTGCCDLAVSTGSVNLMLAGMYGVPALGWGDLGSWVLLGEKQHPWFPNIYQIMCKENWDKNTVVHTLIERMNKIYSLWGLR